jgi:hypothetical protein
VPLDPNPTLSPMTNIALDDLTDAVVRREYNMNTPDQVRALRKIAVAAMASDMRHNWLENETSDRGLTSAADTLVNIALTERLQQRECQCSRLHPHGCSHYYKAEPFCKGHFEADVPDIDGVKLCGSCHNVEWQARYPSIAE